MNTKIDVLIPEEDIRKRISEMAAELSEKYKGEEVLLVGILSSIQLWQRHGIVRQSADHKRSGALY